MIDADGMREVHRALDTTVDTSIAGSDPVYASLFIGVRAPWESSGFRRRSVAILVQSRRLSVSGPGLLKRPCRFSGGYAEASQRRNRGVHSDVGIGAAPDAPTRRIREGRVGDVPYRANASKHVVEFGAQHRQALDRQVVSPTQTQMLHHFQEPDSMRVARCQG